MNSLPFDKLRTSLQKKPAKLVLEDGRVFRGWVFGSDGETAGEICFNTGMTGYQEILTDPSYYGQIVTMTYPHIGNYGVNPDDGESSRIQVAGFVVREETKVPSNYRSTMSLGEYLRQTGIVGIQGIDTRALTRHICTRGAMNGIISSLDLNESSLLEKVKAVPSMNGLDLVKYVTCERLYKWNEETSDQSRLSSSGAVGGISMQTYTSIPDSSLRTPHFKVAAIDFGVKFNSLRLLKLYGCDVFVFPATATAFDVLDVNPDGIYLSNGPGDPAAVTYGIETIKLLVGKKPIFGICLGHQLLALAVGGKTYKLKFGHRGINHPVKRIETGRVEITSQNHGFAVDSDSLPQDVEVTHWNLNDNTVEGIRCKNFPAFSVQYHPEASPGPHDSRYLFEKFIQLMKETSS